MATRSRRLFIGCGVGCLGIVLLGIGACVSFNVWITQPGALLEPTRLLARDTTAFVEWKLRPEDPGSAAFVESLLGLEERLNARNPNRGPTWLNQILRKSREKNRAQAVRELMPAVVAWTIRPGATPDSDLHLFTVNVKSMGNRSRFMDLLLRFTLGLKFSVVHGDERIYAVDEGAMFIRDNSFFFTNSLANAKLIVDRLGSEVWEADRDPTELELGLSSLAGAPLHGSIGNARGELTRLWARMAELDDGESPPEVWSEIRGATLTGGFAGQTAFECVVTFRGPDESWAQTHAEGFGDLLRAGLGLDHSPARLRADPDGDSIRVTFTVEDIFSFLDEM